MFSSKRGTPSGASSASKRSRGDDDDPDYVDDDESVDDDGFGMCTRQWILGGAEKVFKEAASVPTVARLELDETESDESVSCHDSLSRLFGDGLHDYGKLELKPNAHLRPLFISPNGHIFLETFGDRRLYHTAYDFLIAVAEPVCRPRLIQEYKLTPYSLYAAVSVGVTTEVMLDVMDRLSKNGVPGKVRKLIRLCTANIGKVKLVLKHNKYFIESQYPEFLQKLLRDSVISQARVREADSTALTVSAAPRREYAISGFSKDGEKGEANGAAAKEIEEELYNLNKLINKDEDEDEEARTQVHSFEIDRLQVEAVKKRCVFDLDTPLLEEYDFRNDTLNPNLNIDLKPTTVLRPYQEKSLAKMFGNGRGRSGVIVLPCGAGKTLTGVTIACTVKKRTLVLCTSSVAVEQWINQFKMWSTLTDAHIARFTSSEKPMPPDVCVLVSTYNMLGFQGHRSNVAAKVMDKIQSLEWGLLIMDEVHFIPARMFRKVLTNVATHCKVGLTATLVREDDKINDLNFLIGPKLYEANWMDLQNANFLAKVKCWEVWCPMTPEFYHHYLRQTDKKRMLFWTTNPNKYRIARYLAEENEKKGNKVIIFSDNVFALKTFAKMMDKYYICGDVKAQERLIILDKFVTSKHCNIIFVSKVADNSIDMPDANVLIQISSMYGSRRQEAQRLGRILRAKKGQPKPGPGEYNANFYSLVSQDTAEMYFSTKRQQFLVDQGYAYEVMTEVPGMVPEKIMTKDEERNLLASVLEAMDDSVEDEDLSGIDPDLLSQGKKKGVTRRTGNMAGLSGGQGMVYTEFSKPRLALFKQRYKK